MGILNKIKTFLVFFRDANFVCCGGVLLREGNEGMTRMCVERIHRIKGTLKMVPWIRNVLFLLLLGEFGLIFVDGCVYIDRVEMMGEREC